MPHQQSYEKHQRLLRGELDEFPAESAQKQQWNPAQHGLDPNFPQDAGLMQPAALTQLAVMCPVSLAQPAVMQPVMLAQLPSTQGFHTLVLTPFFEHTSDPF